jgi:hypothetical protein
MDTIESNCSNTLQLSNGKMPLNSMGHDVPKTLEFGILAQLDMSRNVGFS